MFHTLTRSLLATVPVWWLMCASACDSTTGPDAAACPVGQELCDDTCVAVASDIEHCGVCGNACGDDEVCDGSGTCAATCADDTIVCDGACIDPLTDNDYCGASDDCIGADDGVSCPQGFSCEDGLCAPPPILVEQIALGTSHTCAAGDDGGVRCWGGRQHGELGNGDMDLVTWPFPVDVLEGPLAPPTDMTEVVQIAAGEASHTCARKADGTVKCWGTNNKGQLGTGTIGDSSPHPTAVVGIDDAVHVDVSRYFACAIRSDASVWCWGDNDHHQLGVTDVPNSSTPVKMESLADVQALTLGLNYACALDGLGDVYCWGRNEWGQTGDGSVTDHANPTKVTGLTGVVEIAAGGWHTCARQSDDTVQCWGFNMHGQLGLPADEVAHLTPAPATGLSGVAQLSLGWKYSCATLSDGTVQCWGNNSDGQLGWSAPDDVPHPAPTTVPGLPPAVQVTAAHQHTCAVGADGTSWCWGYNASGQLGDGTNDSRYWAAEVMY